MKSSNYCDVLLSVQSSASARAWYWVLTVRAKNSDIARQSARMGIIRAGRKDGCIPCSVVPMSVGPCGSFDNFRGKYVGQFIDEALCQKES